MKLGNLTIFIQMRRAQKNTQTAMLVLDKIVPGCNKIQKKAIDNVIHLKKSAFNNNIKTPQKYFAIFALLNYNTR